MAWRRGLKSAWLNIEIDNFMSKERLKNSLKKPDFRIICPAKLYERVPPQTLIKTQKQFFTPGTGYAQSYTSTKLAPSTCMNWRTGARIVSSEKAARESEDRSSNILKRVKPAHKRWTSKNSPYVKNLKDYERIVRLLKPVSGPTQSLIEQIKRHNETNIKKAESVLLSSKNSFQEKITKFSSRMGFKQSEKIFIMNSRDRHIREVLQNNGWVQVNDCTSPFYHLKWCYIDTPSDYQSLQEGQLFNHFKNNQELTNKNLLRKNIYKAARTLQPNYPLTLDLELSEDQTAFYQQYRKYQWLKILLQLGEFIDQHFKPYRLKLQTLRIPQLCVSQMRCQAAHKSGRNNLIKIMEVHQLRQQKSQQVKQLREVLYWITFGLNTGGNHQSQSNSNKLVGYSAGRSCQRYKSLANEQKLMTVLKHDRFLLAGLIANWKRVRSEGEDDLGFRNWWIVKPTGISRGIGIRIETEMAKITSQKYGRIAQKYIERPLLLDCGRKFDIRQWVMVRSFVPFQAYVFQTCYCRFSPSLYSQDTPQLQTHLTNYSQNKEAFSRDNKMEQSVMSEADLEQIIDRQTWLGKWGRVKAAMNLEIAKTLKCCQHQIQSRPECFQVYGFDILLDSYYQPWILQVNLSPACERRCDFLAGYLKKMAEGVLDLVDGRPELRHWQRLQQPSQNGPNQARKQSARFVEEKAAIRIQRFVRSKLRGAFH